MRTSDPATRNLYTRKLSCITDCWSKSCFFISKKNEHIFPVFYNKYCYMLMAPWLIITGSGLHDWIYWCLLLQPLLITINYNNSQSTYCRGLAPFSFSCLYPLKTSELNYRTDWTQSRALAYCRQPASTVTLVIEPRWDPFVQCQDFFFFRCSFFDKKGGVGLFL
jgi:hypothetical protein